MLGQGLYFLAAIMVLSTLLRDPQPAYLLISLLCIGLSCLIRFAYNRFHRSTLVLLTGGLLGATVVVSSLLSGLGLGPTLCGGALLVLIVAMGSGARTVLIALIASSLPLVGLTLSILLQVTGHGNADPALRLIAASLAAWPMISLLTTGRHWQLTAIFGAAGVMFISHHILLDIDFRLADLLLMHQATWTHLDTVLAIAQTILVGASVLPLLKESDRNWRWIMILGFLGIMGPILTVILTGPWHAGWPPLLWWFIFPSLALFLIGLVGMLCTVRQADLMSDAAIRTMTLGIGASAALLLPYLTLNLSSDDLLAGLMAAMSPMLWGCILATLLSIAGMVARRRGSQRTARWIDERLRFRLNVVKWMHTTGKQMLNDMKIEARAVLAPKGLVPLLIVLSAWPAIEELGFSVLVSLLFIPALLITIVIRFSVMLWAALLACHFVLAALILGAPPWTALGLTAAALASCWPYLRWPSLHAAWAYPNGLLLIGVCWPGLSADEGTGLNLALSLGVAVLIGNVLVSTGARAAMVVIGSLWILLQLAAWIPQRDPYVALQLGDLTMNGELAHVFLQLPPLLFMLMVLWLNELRSSQQQWLCANWQRQVMLGLAIAMAVVWSVDWRLNTLMGLLLWLMFLSFLPIFARELRRNSDAVLHMPGIVVASMALAALLIGGGRASEVVHWHLINNGAERLADLPLTEQYVSPGTLGSILIASLRDLATIAGSAVVLLAINHVLQHPQRWIRLWQRLLALLMIVRSGIIGLSKKLPLSRLRS